ncbi:UvrD-helicase domain-containing protein [Lentibacillus cibarius]|uniref:DNA 3'-5' helicase n=1 Tax=Lentibacillus cibarius TaxID=2583219 RepID=A0A5S3QMP0_9BACI|nr:ATP-dependent helicase [Lentibacillus cibarius]TMN23222.1 ATP-dependent helicase [Lentibacillus cibarius]
MENYSRLIFQMNINETVIEELVSFLCEGTKVYFFTYDPTDILFENKVIKFATDFQLFFAYEVPFHSELHYSFNHTNGEVPKPVLEFLDKNAAYFNKQQFLIEHALVNENISVSAGAGTGKTTVMLNRIMFLKYKNPSMTFSELALITFTNKAANNMRQKLIDKIKVYFKITNDLKYLSWLQELKDMTIGTIHSFARQILNLNMNSMFENKDIRVSKFTYKRRKIIEEVIDEFHEEKPKLFAKFKYIEQYRIVYAVESIINQLRNYSFSVNAIQNMDFGYADDGSHELFEFVVKETINRLETYKAEAGYIEVNDLITNLELLKSKEIGYEIPFKYIFIDEFQDTDRQQTMFFSYLVNHYPLSLFVVGDVKQSIYRFRGADYTAFKQLKGQVTIHQEHFLQINYRSDKNLLTQLNNIFKVWPDWVKTFKFDKKDYLIDGFEPEKQLDKPVVNQTFQTNASLINYLRKVENTDTAVLVRSNREVNELSALCEENNIFYTADRDGDFYRTIAVREFYQLLKRFTHPKVWNNRYMLHLSSYGERSLPVADVLSGFNADKMYIRQLLTDKDQLLEPFEEQFKNKPVFEVLQEIVQTINPAKVYAERFISDKSVTGTEKDAKYYLEQARTLSHEYQLNLDHLIYLLKEESRGTVPTLSKLLNILSLKMTTDKSITKLTSTEPGNARLSIMTVHKAKGLDFDYVFLPYTERSFNSYSKTDVVTSGNAIGYKTFISKGKTYKNDVYKSLRTDEIFEEAGEETRLLYVALTRAKKGVYLDAPDYSHSQTATRWGDLIAKGLEKETTNTAH